MKKVYFDNGLKKLSLEEKNNLLKKYNFQQDDIQICYTDKGILLSSGQKRGDGSIFFVSNVFDLGSSLEEIKSVLKAFTKQGLNIVCVTEGYEFFEGEKSETLIKGMEIAIDIKKMCHSFVIKNTIQKKRENGEKVGRHIGSKNKKPSLCEVHKDFIFQSLKNGVSKSQIAKTVGVTSRTIFNFERQNGSR